MPKAERGFEVVRRLKLGQRRGCQVDDLSLSPVFIVTVLLNVQNVFSLSVRPR